MSSGFVATHSHFCPPCRYERKNTRTEGVCRGISNTRREKKTSKKILPLSRGRTCFKFCLQGVRQKHWPWWSLYRNAACLRCHRRGHSELLRWRTNQGRWQSSLDRLRRSWRSLQEHSPTPRISDKTHGPSHDIMLTRKAHLLPTFRPRYLPGRCQD